MTNDEEELRRSLLDETGLSEQELNDHYAPGTFGCHEALHMTHVLTDMINRELLNHPAILRHPEWFAVVSRVCETLADLYQDIGGQHVGNRQG